MLITSAALLLLHVAHAYATAVIGCGLLLFLRLLIFCPPGAVVSCVGGVGNPVASAVIGSSSLLNFALLCMRGFARPPFPPVIADFGFFPGGLFSYPSDHSHFLPSWC